MECQKTPIEQDAIVSDAAAGQVQARDVFHGLAQEYERLTGLRPPAPTASEWFLIRSRPELGPFLGKFPIAFKSSLPGPFLVADHQIMLNPGAMLCPSLGAFYLRHAFELAILESGELNLPDRIGAAVRAVLAAHTALQYFDLMVEPAKRSTADLLPGWMKDALPLAANGAESSEIAERLIGYITDLVALAGQQGFGPLTAEEYRQAMSAILQALDYAVPVEALLTIGGDARLKIDRATGLNQYGCSPRPRPWAITFSSCTASSISDGAYRRAESVRQHMLTRGLSGEADTAARQQVEIVRAQVKNLLGLDEVAGADLILAASGTDVELFAVHVALSMAKSAPYVLNIVVGPDEIGSGSRAAAAGRHFCNTTPLGRGVLEGSRIDGLAAEQIRVHYVDIRNEDGEVLSPEEVDRRVTEATSAAVEEGGVVLLHVLDSSKTELSAPSTGCLMALKQRFGDAVIALVDAAQMRLTEASLHAYLASNAMVMITASKFFTAPPFAGAVVIPPQLADMLDDMAPLPSGFKDYAAITDFPERWRTLTRDLTEHTNTGLLFRWHAGAWEMSMFQQVPEGRRFDIIRAFGEAVVHMIAANPYLDLVHGRQDSENVAERAANWAELATIFSFQVNVVEDGGTPAPAGYEHARIIYSLLNADISPLLPARISERNRILGAKRCHVGQPVRIGGSDGAPVGALRVAAGARFVYGIEYDENLGENAEERLAAELRDVGTVLEKIALIAQYWPVLRDADHQFAAPRPPDYSF